MKVFLVFFISIMACCFLVNLALLLRAKKHTNKFIDKIFLKYKGLNNFLKLEKQGWSIFTVKTSLSLFDLSIINWLSQRNFRIQTKDCGGVADPFLVKENELYYLFFEYEYKKELNIGADLAYASSIDGENWTFQKKIIQENFHQSFPYVFKEDDAYYLLPETNEANEIRLYKAVEFPNDWVFETVLQTGAKFVDTIFLKKDIHYYWITTNLETDELLLFYSSSFKGNWVKHPSSPITKSKKNNRNAGAIIEVENKYYRVAQDARDGYGSGVNLYQITELTTKTYREELVKEPLFYKSNGLIKDAIHHLSILHLGSKKLIATDGANFATKGIKIKV